MTRGLRAAVVIVPGGTHALRRQLLDAVTDQDWEPRCTLSAPSPLLEVAMRHEHLRVAISPHRER